jgi:hypothetical protein
MIELLKYIAEEYGIVAVFALLLFWQNYQQTKRSDERMDKTLSVMIDLTGTIKVAVDEIKNLKIQVDQLTDYTIEHNKRDTEKFRILEQNLKSGIRHKGGELLA